MSYKEDNLTTGRFWSKSGITSTNPNLTSSLINSSNFLQNEGILLTFK